MSHLILKLKKDESLALGDGIKLHFSSHHGVPMNVRVRIEAPREMAIKRFRVEQGALNDRILAKTSAPTSE